MKVELIPLSPRRTVSNRHYPRNRPRKPCPIVPSRSLSGSPPGTLSKLSSKDVPATASGLLHVKGLLSDRFTVQMIHATPTSCTNFSGAGGEDPRVDFHFSYPNLLRKQLNVGSPRSSDPGLGLGLLIAAPSATLSNIQRGESVCKAKRGGEKDRGSSHD